MSIRQNITEKTYSIACLEDFTINPKPNNASLANMQVNRGSKQAMNISQSIRSRIIQISIVLILFMLIPATAFSMACSYDKNGNMISDGKQCYEYNDANRLSRVSNCYSGQLIAEYFYDHAGQRLKKKEYENNVLKHTTYYTGKHYETKVFPDGRSEKTSYYYAGNERIARKDPDGKKYFYHSDHLGSNSVITDENGQLVEKTKYTPFGSVTEGGTKSKHLYTGQEKDFETGLYYYSARHYNPELRRFVQADSIMPDVYDPQQLNRYSYTRNNPLIYIDPSGNLLVAVDGTDSKKWKKKKGYKSHVKNFFNDYGKQDGEGKEYKKYWDGPNLTVSGWDGRYIHKKLMNWINARLAENPDQPVNLVGHSRGGYIVRQVALELEENGINVNFVGTFDAVDMMPFYGKDDMPDASINVKSSPSSRGFFRKMSDGQTLNATHSAIGGDFVGGDHPSDITNYENIKNSIKSNIIIRSKAKTRGINLNDRVYYGGRWY